MPPDVTGNFSAAGGMAHVDCVLQVKLFGQRGEVVGVGVHLVTIPCLGRTAMTASIVRNDPIAILTEEQHLSVPVVRAERPAMTENYRLSRSPVLVINLRTVFRGNRWHKLLSLNLNCVSTALTARSKCADHVLISLVGIGSGLIVMFGFLTGKRLDALTAIFLTKGMCCCGHA